MKTFPAQILLLPSLAIALRAAVPSVPSESLTPPNGSSSVVAAPSATTTAGAKRGEVDDYEFVGFDELAGFPFQTPATEASGVAATEVMAKVMAQIPEPVRKLDGRKVTVMGFLLPTKIEGGLATEFLLLNSPMMCCFGTTPSTNGWIVVKMPKGVPPVQDVPTRFRGTLHVRAQWENGWLASVYQLDGYEPGRPST